MNSNKDLITPWDVNSKARHEQIISGIDISFSHLLTPEIIDILMNSKNSSSFYALDVGCGTGVLTQLLSGHVRKVIGIDPSCDSINIARQAFSEDNLSFVCSDIESYSSSNLATFDFIVAHMTLHTIHRAELAIKKISSLLKNKGLFVFSIPHPAFYTERERLKNVVIDYKYCETMLFKIPFTISNDPTPLPAEVPYFHRPIEDYNKFLFEAGFCIHRILEPMPTDEIKKLYPKEKKWDNPHFMIFSCHKAIFHS